jgi:hypothetical protein
MQVDRKMAAELADWLDAHASVAGVTNWVAFAKTMTDIANFLRALAAGQDAPAEVLAWNGKPLLFVVWQLLKDGRADDAWKMLDEHFRPGASSLPSAPASEREALQALYEEYLRLNGCFPLPQSKGYAALMQARAALARDQQGGRG